MTITLGGAAIIDIRLGTAAVAAVHSGATKIWPADAGEPVVVSTNAQAMTATESPTVTIAAAGLAGDVVVAWIASASNATLVTVPADWTNVLGGTTLATPGDGSLVVACLIHEITPAEQTAGTVSWTMTDLFAIAETGEILNAVTRHINASPLDAVNTATNASPVSTHVLAGLPGGDVATGSLVLSGLFPDGLQTYTSPAGWDQLETSTGTNQGGGLFARTALTTAGADVAATNVAASSADEYVSVTVALAAA